MPFLILVSERQSASDLRVCKGELDGSILKYVTESKSRSITQRWRAITFRKTCSGGAPHC